MGSEVIKYIVPRPHMWDMKDERIQPMDHEELMVKYSDYKLLEEELSRIKNTMK